MASEVRKYFVKAGMRTNLDSMNTSLTVILFDMQNGLYDEKEVMGEKMDYDRVWEFREEVQDLLDKANFGKVTGKEYGRIKEISHERDMWRYTRNIEAGVSEDRLQHCFLT